MPRPANQWDADSEGVHPGVSGSAALDRLVAALSGAIIVPHASPESHTLILSANSLLAGKPIRTFDDDANADLIRRGALKIDTMSLLSGLILPTIKPLTTF